MGVTDYFQGNTLHIDAKYIIRAIGEHVGYMQIMQRNGVLCDLSVRGMEFRRYGASMEIEY